MGFDPIHIFQPIRNEIFDIRLSSKTTLRLIERSVRSSVRGKTFHPVFSATGTKRAARDGEADTNAGIDTQRWRKPARRAGCISRPWKRSSSEERRHPVSRIPSRSETERGGLTGVQSTRMLCMQMRSDRPIGYLVLERPPHGSSSSRSLLPCPLAGPWTEARLGLWSLDSV